FRRCQQLAEEFLSFNASLTSPQPQTVANHSTTRKPAPLLLLHHLNHPTVAFVSALSFAARGEL
ncbi:hypothetical protein, partial [Ralstonia soli]